MSMELYRCYAHDGSLLYVGISLNALNRLRKHKFKSMWFGSLTNLTVEHFPTRMAALIAEQQAIIREKPVYNRFRPVEKGDMPEAWTLEKRRLQSDLVRIGQARARAEGRFPGRPSRYSDALIGEAIRRHDSGEPWAAIAAGLSISEPWLYARVSKFRKRISERLTE